jgi:hypothetical protein
MRRFFLILSLFLIGCNSSLERNDSTQYDKGSFNQLTKTDFDRMADYEIKENTESLRILALKFYKKNPAELRKTTSDSPEVTVNWLFTSQHNWKFKEINDAQGIEALDQVFDENFKGDRVLSLITGLYTMLITAHDNQKEFDMFDSLDPQLIYNAARNVEVIVWRLSTKRKKMESYSLLQMKLMMILKTYHLKESLEKLLVERIILLTYYLKKKSGI